MYKRLFFTMALLITMPLFIMAQYINQLYAYDSLPDFGWNVFAQTDSNNDYLVFVAGCFGAQNNSDIAWMTISQNGDTVFHKNTLLADTLFSYYQGNPGAVKKLSDGGYMIPLTKQVTPAIVSQWRSFAGICRLKNSLDTMFVKMYTDTSMYFDVINDGSVMPDGGFLLGGERYTGTFGIGLVIRTDSMGNMLWENTYRYNYRDETQVYTIEALPNGNILIGATDISVEDVPGSSEAYYKYAPWYIITDSMGNIIKDTLYASRYAGGGSIYADNNGGYYQWGWLDTLYIPTDVYAFDNFPYYVAHLDSNFNVQWCTPTSGVNSQGYIWRVQQLTDSTYLATGDKADTTAIPYYGWAAKIDKNGNILWSLSLIHISEPTRPY